MKFITFTLFVLSAPALTHAAWFGSQINRNAPLCATLLVPLQGVRADQTRSKILEQLHAYLDAVAHDVNGPVKKRDVERLIELTATLHSHDLTKTGLRAWTLTGSRAIEQYAVDLTTARAAIETDIATFENKLGNFKTRAGAAMTDALVGLSPIFYLRSVDLETAGIMDWAAHSYANPAPLLAANVVILGFAALGALDAPWRFLATRQPGYAQMQNTIATFLAGPKTTGHWGTRFKISDELVRYVYRADKVSGKILSDQNLRERMPGLARTFWDWRRRRRGYLDAQFLADALFWHSPAGEPNLTLIVQRKTEPK